MTNQNRFQQYIKGQDGFNTGIASTVLEKIEEKHTSSKQRSSSQGTYSGTSKFQSMKTKLNPTISNVESSVGGCRTNEATKSANSYNIKGLTSLKIEENASSNRNTTQTMNT